MKITAIQTNAEAFLIEVDGKLYPCVYREILANQGIVIVHPALRAGSALASQDPTNEDAELIQIDNAIDNDELAAWISRWARGKVQDGTHPVDIETS